MRSARSLAVLLFGARIGEVYRTAAGRPAFAYEPAWAESGPGIPLSVSMPMAVLEHGPKVVAPYLWGLLPDSEARLDEIVRSADRRIAVGNPVALLGEVGEDCAGAVQFVTPDRLEFLEKEGGVDWLDQAGVAEVLRRCRTGASPTTSPGIGRGRGNYSVAGMQPKAALYREPSADGDRWGVPRGRTPTTHILKPPIPGLEGQVENEHFCLRLASALGFAVANSEVISFGQEQAIVVERYDRVRLADGGVVRVHQEDMCQALAVMPKDKYQHDGGPSPERIVNDVLRRSAAARELVESDVRSFLAAVALNWLIAGTDAHGKNFSIVHGRGGAFRLAPLYDVMSALPYDDLRDVAMSFKVGGHYDFALQPRHWERLARGCRFDPGEMIAVVSSLAARCPDLAGDVAAQCRSDGLEHPAIATLSRMVRERCQSIYAVYGTRGSTPLEDRHGDDATPAVVDRK